MIKSKTAFYALDVRGVSVGFFDFDNVVVRMTYDYFSLLNNCICAIKIILLL